MAETKEQRAESKNEIRLTLGDCMWETLIWHNDPDRSANPWIAPGQEVTYNTNYFYTPHIGLEYHYRINHWLSAGLLADIQATTWTKRTFGIDEIGSSFYSNKKENFYNLAIMPSVRFTYFWKEHVNLYSSIALGLDINGGSETDLRGHHTGFGAALDVTILGIAAGKNHWQGLIELGGLSALKNKDTMYMMCSKIIALGVSYSF